MWLTMPAATTEMTKANMTLVCDARKFAKIKMTSTHEKERIVEPTR